MREEEWAISTDDGHKIYGVTNYASEGQANRCLVLVHGLSGHRNEYHLKTAAHYFVAKGYDVMRFDLYSGQPQGRNLRNCTLQTHAADLNHVLGIKAQDSKYLYISGHSYGAPSIMVGQPKQANAISLWDPSFNFRKLFGKRIDFQKENDLIIWSGAVDKVIGEAFWQEALNCYDTEECLALSKSLSDVPIQVIHAGECIYAEDKYSWHSAGHPANERHLIKGADHCFHRGNALDKALALSHQWFERWGE